MVTPSTGVTGRPDINPNSVPCDIVSRWPDGRFLAFHAVGPGSIPGRCRLHPVNTCNV